MLEVEHGADEVVHLIVIDKFLNENINVGECGRNEGLVAHLCHEVSSIFLGVILNAQVIGMD